MIDPITISAAVGIASSAFKTIKEGFAIGKDVEGMTKDISRWMGAVSDVDNAEKMAKNPPLFKKLFSAGSVEEEAMAAYIAKKKLAEQRQELKTWLNMTQGPGAYDDLLAMEGRIRKQRQEAIYKQQQMRQKVFEWIGIFLLIGVVAAFILFIAFLWGKKANADTYKYTPKSYTKQQQIHQGLITKKKYTTCRLKRILKSRHTGKQACIYLGGNKTYTLMYEELCPKSYKCVYNPNSKEPNIDDVISSLKNAVK